MTVEDLLTAAGVSRRTFYRLYADKEAVALALYQLGTAGLLSAATAAMADEADRIKKLERCVDAHLTNARVFGRLVFVLGGEAQRQESPLHPRRRATHDALVAMLAQGAPEVPALTLRAAVVAVEAVTRMALEACDEGRNVRDEVLDEARAFLLRMAEAVLA